MRIVYFGSGAFGLPTLTALHRDHDVRLVVSQPDRPAGRKRMLTPTPVAQWALEQGLEVIRPENVNVDAVTEAIRGVEADAWVVIAFGQKLSQPLLADRFAMNLHGSLLPKYRGAAPINHAMINGEAETGVCAITLADRMDAGLVLGSRSTPIDPRETAGELHDRLAGLGPELIAHCLAAHADGTLQGEKQDEALATKAPKFRKADGTVGFDQPAVAVRCRVHGLTPWPGCRVTFDGNDVFLRRVEEVARDDARAAGAIADDGTIACATGAVRILEIQAPGSRVMSFADYVNGRPLSDDPVAAAR